VIFQNENFIFGNGRTGKRGVRHLYENITFPLSGNRSGIGGGSGGGKCANERGPVE